MTFTVQQLIDELECIDDKDSPVYFQYPSGDYWHTILAGSINEVGSGAVSFSGYHSKNKITADADDLEYDHENDQMVDDNGEPVELVVILK